MSAFNREFKHVEKWNFLKSNTFIQISIFEVETPPFALWIQKIYQQIFINCIELDLLKTEQYEWIQNSSLFSLHVFQTNTNLKHKFWQITKDESTYH